MDAEVQQDLRCGTPRCPTFRRDLRVSRQRHRGQNVVVIKDPVNGSFFRISAEEYELLRSMNGRRPIDGVRRDFETARGRPFAEDRLTKLVERVHSFRLFEEDVKAPASVAGDRRVSKRFIRGDVLHLRFKAVDPDALLAALLRRIRFLFSPTFVALASACIVSAIALLPFQWGAYGEQLERLHRLRSVGLAWVAISAILIVHELAHGLTCKHFGGEVREMGFGLVYFQPCLYTDVSDSYLFPDKGRRLWVMLSGSFVQTFLWALAVFAWTFVLDEGPWKDACFVVIAVAGIGLLFNFNPLLKLDGYYILCDLLELPNLRGKSFAYLRARLLPGRRGAAAAGETFREAERPIYLWYGVSAILYSVFLLGYVAYLAIRFFSSP